MQDTLALSLISLAVWIAYSVPTFLSNNKELSMTDTFAIISGIPTEDLADTMAAQKEDGWTISEQIYIGEDLWELVLVKEAATQEIDAS